MACAHGHRRERPDEWVVDGLAVVAPILEATWAPRAGCLLQLVYGKDLGPGQQRQESQVAPASLLLESVHHSSSQCVYHGGKRTAISEWGERQFRTKSYTDFDTAELT